MKPRTLLMMISIPLAGLLGGCGTMGETYAHKVELAPQFRIAGVIPALGSVTADPGAGKNQATGAYNIGKFGASDLATLNESLCLTLVSEATHAAGPQIHVRVRHFALAFSNQQVAGFSITDWCLAQHGNVIFSERFYTAFDSGASMYHITTLGGGKTKILDAMVARICQNSIAVANGREKAKVPLTFDDARSATDGLPTLMIAANTEGVSQLLLTMALGGFANAVDLMPDAPIPENDWPAIVNVTAPPAH